MTGFKLPGVAWVTLLTIVLPLLAAYLTDNWGAETWVGPVVGAILMVSKLVEEYSRAMSAPAMPAGVSGESGPRHSINWSNVVWG